MTEGAEIEVSQASKGYRWLLTLTALGFVGIVLYLWLGPAKDPELLSGFKGNLIAGVIGSLVFLWLGDYLNRKVDRIQEETHQLAKQTRDLSGQTHQLTEQTHSLSAGTHETAKQTQKILQLHEEARDQRDALKQQAAEQRARLAEFERFLQTETYHDVRLVELTTPLQPMGMQYTIRPVRGPDGKLAVRKTEMEEMYLLKVDEPAQMRVLPPEILREYAAAEIHTGEAYFCRIYNGDWHMGQDSVGNGWHRIHLSGKVGSCEVGLSANEFLELHMPPPDVVWKEQLLINDDGTLMSGEGGCWQAHLYKDSSGTIWVQPSRLAPPKRVCLEVDHLKDTTAIVIDNFEGYFPGAARQNFVDLISRTIEAAGHTIPKYDKYW